MDAINPPPPSSDYLNFPIDDLLDFSNDDLFSPSSSSSSTTTSTSSDHQHHLPSLHPSFPPTPACTDYFADQLSLPNDDVAELEWLSQFVDDSFTDFPPNSTLTGTINVQSNPGFSAAASRAARSKRSRGGSAANGNSSASAAAWVSHSSILLPPGRSKSSRASSPVGDGEVRRCTHCASEKTPQWRTGPLGPKTLCNACGVRYKSGRLVPEYRPAASPTFVLTQHSNSHRKVMELRRQKEMFRQPPQETHQQLAIYNHHHQDFKAY